MDFILGLVRGLLVTLGDLADLVLGFIASN